MNAHVITRPTITDVTNLNEMVMFLAIEVKDAKVRQETLFKKALTTPCVFERKALMTDVESLQVVEISLSKHLSSVHYQALEQLGDDDVVISFPQVA